MQRSKNILRKKRCRKGKTFKRRSTYKRGGMYTKPEFIINNRVNWNFLSRNPNATHLLENNQDRIDWRALSGNPNAIDIISRYDYNRMTQKNRAPAEELVSTVMHPKRTRRMAKSHGISMSKYIDTFSNVPDDYSDDDEDNNVILSLNTYLKKILFSISSFTFCLFSF